MSPGTKVDSKDGRSRRTFAVALVGLVALAALAVAATRSHSFDIVVDSIVVCEDSATFDGTPIAASSLDKLLTSQIFDSGGTTLLATGNSHTFTAVGETFTFVVPYPPGTVSLGDTVTLSVTDSPPMIQGDEGDAATATVIECAVPAPALPSWSAAILALALVAGGGAWLSRGLRGGPAPQQP